MPSGDSPDTNAPVRFLTRTPRPVIVAHRYGNAADLARDAKRAGADLLEADVWLRHGRLEIRHHKTLGPLPFIWDRWWIARKPREPFDLVSLLRAPDTHMPIMFDLKGRNRRLATALMDAIQNLGDDRTILVCSPNWSLLDPFRGHERIEVVHSIGSREALQRAWPALADDWRESVSIHRELLDHDIVQRLKSLVHAVITWPVNTQDHLEEVLSFGVDGVTTDSLDIMEHIAKTRSAASAEKM